MAGPSLLMMGLDKSTMPRGSREPERWDAQGNRVLTKEHLE